MKTKNICIWCEKEPIYIKKRNLGKKCYHRWLNENRKLKKCKIVGCEKGCTGRGLCAMHYSRVRGGIEDMRPEPLPGCGWYRRKRIAAKDKVLCTIKECNKLQYAKGLCHNHYEKNRRHGNPLYKRPISICTIDGCSDRITGNGLCRLHWSRQRNGTVLTKEKGNNGSLNYKWKGGIAQYPNHSLMKKNRRIALERDNYKCFSCKKEAAEIHHLDLSRDNHALENLVASCHKCNSKHRNNHIDYKSLYGRYAVEIKRILNISDNHVRFLHNAGELKRKLCKA